MSQIIIFVADDNYIDHVKSIATNCRIEGGFTGDIAVICKPNSKAAEEFKKYLIVLEVEADGFLQKFSVFHDFFKQWDQAIYLDCDILIQDDLQRLFALLERGNMWMDVEDCNTIESLWRDPNPKDHEATYELIRTKYPDSLKRTWNTAFIIFKPQTLDSGIPEKLMAIQNEVEEVNNQSTGGTDQQVINLLLWDKVSKIPNKLCCFWGLAEPENDRLNPERGFVGGEIPVGIHYSRWYAPWIEKTSIMDSYLCHYLKTPVNDIYKRNLAKFNERFPQL